MPNGFSGGPLHIYLVYTTFVRSERVQLDNLLVRYVCRYPSNVLNPYYLCIEVSQTPKLFFSYVISLYTDSNLDAMSKNSPKKEARFYAF